MLISKLAEPAEPSDLLPTLPTLPGEAAVDAPLVDQVVAALNQIYRAKGMETARAVGELLLGTFFEGDPAYFHERGKDHASFRQLAERDDLHFSHAFLWSACAVVEQLRQLPKDVAGALPLSHHKLLLTVKDPAEKERLAREAADQDLSKRELEARVHSLRADVPPESRSGRKPLPAVLKGLSRLKAAVALASSEQVSAATFTTVEPEKATAMLADLDEQIAALGRLRKAVRAALK